MPHFRKILTSSLAVFVLFSCTGAFSSGSATVSLFESPPNVDGSIKPDEWNGAVRIRGFQGLGANAIVDKVSASWVGYTKNRLYFAVVSELPPDGELAAMKKPPKNDQTYGVGGIEVWIDANRWKREQTEKSLPFIQFMSNAAGGVFDKKYGVPGKPPNLAWDGDWEVGNTIQKSTDKNSPVQSENGIWMTEVSVPFEDLGVEQTPVGKTIGIMVGRNWKRNRGGQMAWFPHSGAYTEWANYPAIHLTENKPSVQIMSLGDDVFASNLALKTRIYNPADQQRKVQVKATATSSDMPKSEDRKTLTLKPNGFTPYAFEVTDFHENAQHKLHFVVKDTDSETKYLDYAMPWRKPKREKWRAGKTGPEPKKAVQLEYYPSYEFIRITTDPRELGKKGKGIKKAEVTVEGPGGKSVLSGSMNWNKSPAKKRFEIGKNITEGKYTAKIKLEGYDRVFKRTFKRRYFAWEGNRLGITNKVYDPFEPVQKEGDQVSVVMRRYEKNGLGLWKSVQARGNDEGSSLKELLAAPINVKVNDGTVLQGAGKFTSGDKQQVVYKGKATHPSVNVHTTCTTKYDGAMKVEMTLKPGGQDKRLQKLWLDIPLRPETAPLFHATTTGLRNNPAGTIPEEKGVVWNSKAIPSSGWYGNFKPYIWAGGAERGVCWFADNDQHWELDVTPGSPDESAACQELIRRDGQIIIRINMIQKPVTIQKPRKIVFGLMASPAKPMPENWRNMFFRDNPPGPTRRLDWMAAQYWGSPSVMYSKLPIDKDTAVLSKLQEMRLGGGNFGKFMKAWSEKHLSGDISDKTYKSKEKVKGLLNHAARRSRIAGDGFLTVYWEEFHVNAAFHPENDVFGDEWKSHAYPESYLNFACWAGAEFIRRGMGLYFDNTFPKKTTDPITTNAYELPSGRIQPSANMWRQRKYLRRIWVLHQQLAPEATKPLMMLHMTNTHIIPYMVYNMANLDLEWLFGEGTAQSKYPADLLRAETIGLQSGNIPTVLADVPHRTRFGAMMVHEIRPHKCRHKLLTKMGEFGYTKPDAKVYNYWDEDAPLSVSDEECKWLLIKHHGELMVLFCTWNPQSKEIEVTLDSKALGVQPEEAVNVESDKALEVKDGTFRFSMPGHGVRMFHIR